MNTNKGNELLANDGLNTSLVYVENGSIPVKEMWKKKLFTSTYNYRVIDQEMRHCLFETGSIAILFIWKYQFTSKSKLPSFKLSRIMHRTV